MEVVFKLNEVGRTQQTAHGLSCIASAHRLSGLQLLTACRVCLACGEVACLWGDTHTQTLL